MQRFIGALSVAILVLVVVALFLLRPEPVVTLGLVFPILTSLFITASSVVVAYVSVKAYSREGLIGSVLANVVSLIALVETLPTCSV